jgi:hypothetical protein
MSSRRVVLNADDFGYDPAVTRGIEQAMREGVVSSTTMMVNTPHSEDAASRSTGLSIGLHLNLARWASLADPRRSFEQENAATFSPAFVAEELVAQLERLRALTGRPATHVDVHKHLHRHQNVLAGVMSVAKRLRLAVRSIDDRMRHTLRAEGIDTNDAFFGDAGAEAYWTQPRFDAVLHELPSDGLVELMCHPGLEPSHVKSGYSAQRPIELATFLSEASRLHAAEAGVRFEGWP